MNENQRQQGDVIYERVSEIPRGAELTERKKRGFVLAEGEHTGHAHVITETKGVEMYEKDGVLYLKNDVMVNLRHEEHAVQTIEPGIWKIGRIFEHDYTKDMVRNVAD